MLWPFTFDYIDSCIIKIEIILIGTRNKNRSSVNLPSIGKFCGFAFWWVLFSMMMLWANRANIREKCHSGE